jgi:hypothetical protein
VFITLININLIYIDYVFDIKYYGDTLKYYNFTIVIQLPASADIDLIETVSPGDNLTKADEAAV